MCAFSMKHLDGYVVDLVFFTTLGLLATFNGKDSKIPFVSQKIVIVILCFAH